MSPRTRPGAGGTCSVSHLACCPNCLCPACIASGAPARVANVFFGRASARCRVSRNSPRFRHRLVSSTACSFSCLRALSATARAESWYFWANAFNVLSSVIYLGATVCASARILWSRCCSALWHWSRSATMRAKTFSPFRVADLSRRLFARAGARRRAHVRPCRVGW